MNDFMMTVATTIGSEFSDLRDIPEITRIVIRLFVACVLGALLGFEREWSGKAAGVRTHMLVCVGAAAFMLVAQITDMGTPDTARVIQGVITGVGFLGAGAILKRDNETSVSGMTTAAGIWLTAAIGTAVGLGREATAVLSAAVALGTLLVVPLVLDRVLGRKSRGRPSRLP